MAKTPPTMMIYELGVVPYAETARRQRELRAAREAGAITDSLLVLQHEPVITCGTRTEEAEIAYARTTNIPLEPVERGGKATYHGPGQIVIYPIMSLERANNDVKVLVIRLEQAIIDTLASVNVDAERRCGLPGVWIKDAQPLPRKIASIGLRLTRGVTFHGIALNINCDLAPFGWFTPCGISDVDVTSVAKEHQATIGREGFTEISARLVQNITKEFHAHPKQGSVEELYAIAAQHPQPSPDIALPGELRPSRRQQQQETVAR